MGHVVRILSIPGDEDFVKWNDLSMLDLREESCLGMERQNEVAWTTNSEGCIFAILTCEDDPEKPAVEKQTSVDPSSLTQFEHHLEISVTFYVCTIDV